MISFRHRRIQTFSLIPKLINFIFILDQLVKFVFTYDICSLATFSLINPSRKTKVETRDTCSRKGMPSSFATDSLTYLNADPFEKSDLYISKRHVLLSRARGSSKKDTRKLRPWTGRGPDTLGPNSAI